MTDKNELDQYELRFVLYRGEWTATEWPAVLFRVGWAVAMLLGVALAAAHSPWWALLLLGWWPLGGADATGILLFLGRGMLRYTLRVRADGIMFVSVNGSEPKYCHWTGFQDCGKAFVLFGGDGRYRCVIPKRALTAADYAALHLRTGVDLTQLGQGVQARIQSGAGGRSA